MLTQTQATRTLPYSTCDPATSPTYQKDPAQANTLPPVTLNWKNSEEPTRWIKKKTIYTVKGKKGGIGVGSLENASYMKTPCMLSKVKLQYKNMQWRTHRPLKTTADAVIATCPGVMSNTETQCHKVTGVLADHVECSQKPRLCQTEYYSSLLSTKLHYN